MKHIDSELPLLKSIMKMFFNQFGERIELVLHDWSKGYEHSIVAIEGNLTNRKVGDCGNNLGLEVLKGTSDPETKANYITKTKDGKTLVSSTLYIKNDEGAPIGALCVNYDITDFVMMKNYCDSFVPTELDINTKNGNKEFFTNNITELLNIMIDDSISKTGKAISQMVKGDKMAVLDDLDKKGVFLITKSTTKVCEVLEISKFTLYNYLDEIKKKSNLI
ncbi:MAG: transcriptional regulator [Spirochaetales bacterium]|jgi:predicted transcriptional regulator YheO|nr:transcriptional regulator [Spirochaetales bacterium]